MKTKTVKKSNSIKVKKVFCKVCPTWEIKNPARCSNTLNKGTHTLYFCTKKCKEKYETKPEKYK